VTSVADEDAPRPSEKAEKNAKAGKSGKPAPTKTRIISPDEFFDDPSPRRMNGVKAKEIYEDDEELEEQIQALEETSKKKSKRSMKAADQDLAQNTQEGVTNPSVSAAAQAILEQVNATEAALAGGNAQ